MSLRGSTGLVTKMMDTAPFKTLMALGFIDIYSGSRPASADDAPAAGNIKLATVYSDGTATGLSFESTAVAGVLAKKASESWSATMLATGTASWFRMREAGDAGTVASTTACRVDGTVSTSGADMNLTSASFAAGAPLTVNNASFTLPKS